jgi:1-acyl-sn-glycerol-3-phosphate acyltransferase
VGTSDIFGRGFMRWLARWIRVVVLDPDANLIPPCEPEPSGYARATYWFSIEGERSDTGKPRVFRKGAAILSIHEQAPIVPVAIEGFYDAWPRHQRWPKLASLRMVFGKPIAPPPVSEASEAAYEKLTAELKERVVAMWRELRQAQGKSTEI